MFCQRCGVALPPNKLPCGNCGYSVPSDTPFQQAGGGDYVVTQAASNAGSYPQGTNNGNYYGSQNQFGSFYTPSSFQRPPYPFTPVPTKVNSFQQAPSLLAGGISQRLTELKSPSTGLFVGIALLIILLIGAGFVGYAFLSAHSLNSTATMGSMPMPKTPPLFSDSFTNNTHGWNLQSDPGKFAVAIGGGFMTLEDSNNKLLWELVPGGKTFTNFSLAVDAVLSKGSQDNGYGVYIRGTSNPDSDFATYYRFELYGDGSYALFKGGIDPKENLMSSRLIDYTTDTVIQKQGKPNHIVITANGSSLLLNVNGQVLSKVTDTSYSSGSIALFVSNLQNTPPGAQAKFSQFAIYPA
jgi:hypothetical protein